MSDTMYYRGARVPVPTQQVETIDSLKKLIEDVCANHNFKSANASQRQNNYHGVLEESKEVDGVIVPAGTEYTAYVLPSKARAKSSICTFRLEDRQLMLLEHRLVWRRYRPTVGRHLSGLT